MPVGAPPIQIQKKQGMGCFGCGCAIVIVLVLLLIGLVVASCYVLYHKALNLTDAAATPLPQTDKGDDIYSNAHVKISQFEDAFERQQPAVLHLSADEINSLIARDPKFEQMRGHFFVTLQGSEATLRYNFALGTYESVILTDRFVDGNVTFGVSFDPPTHNLLFDIHGIEIKNMPVPPSSAESFSRIVNQTVNQKLQANQLARDFMASVQKADIENGELVIEIK
jgi:hypothetical protein